MSTSDKRKNILCKYYVTYGDCFHGENCHYLHALPAQKTPDPQQSINNAQQNEQQIPATSVPSPRVDPVPNQQNQNIMNSSGYQSQQTTAPQQQIYNMNKLICSFKSELPNEIDFALQIVTLLANTNNFSWSKDYAIVDAICTSLPVYVSVCDDSTNEDTYTKFWFKILGHNASNDYLRAASCAPDVDPNHIQFETFDTDSDFNPKVYRRIKSAAEIIRQLSMTACQKNSDNEGNGMTYSYYKSIDQKKRRSKTSRHLLKLVTLLIHCQDMPLILIGLDILSNISSKLCKVPERCNDPICPKLVQMFQEYCIHHITRPDGDIYIINRSIEAVSKILASSNSRVANSIVHIIVEKDLVSRIEQFLTSQYEVTLFLSALEFCYILSRHQPHLLAGKTKYMVKILVNLLDCDDYRYFTPNALKRIKILVKKSDESSSINGHSELSNGFRYHPPRSPLSVSVRLTAALILRNLAAESSEVKQALANHEPILSEICMTNGRDESKIIAECLSLLNDDPNRSQEKEK